MTVGEFISALFSSRDQAHIFHLQTRSFAKHKALDDFYHEIIERADDYVEMYQGRYGLITSYGRIEAPYTGDGQVVAYFRNLLEYIDENRADLPSDTDLNNVVDEISGLVASTLYKLNFLG